MIKPIVTDVQQLKQPSAPASRQDLSIGRDLTDTLRAHQDHCIGMAANMIGEHKRVIIAQLGPLPVVMFNPQITAKARPYQTKEGCLSLSGERPTQRFDQITVQFFDQGWQKQSLTLSGLAAEIVQHEVDHCNGIII